MFPYQPNEEEIDSRLFVCQDLALRSMVLPLFRFDPATPEQRPFGHGTTFRIDPWSRCATAFHVVQDLFQVSAENNSNLVLRDNIRLAALQITEFGYGVYRPITSAWLPISGAYSVCAVESPPFQTPRIRNATELMMLQIRSSDAEPGLTPYLPLDMTRWRPHIGERVMALGYANLDLDDQSNAEDRPISQYLYGSIATITDIERADGKRGRPWPQFRADADWPAGMSGGPIFNENGNVVGIVSTGIVGQGVSSGTYFAGWSFPQQIFRSLDPSNPGWFRCYAVFDASGAIMKCSHDRSLLESFANENDLTEVGLVSINPQTGDHIRMLNRRYM
jgi:serine protease Do